MKKLINDRQKHPRDGVTSRRRWVFRLAAALLVPSVAIASVETVLRWSGAGYPTAFLMPESKNPSFLTDNYKFAWRFFPPALARSSQPIRVRKQTAPGVKRVIVFGGSAAMGDPEPAYGLPRMLKVMLQLRYPKQDFEVINAAVTAVNSHVVLPIVKDCRQLDADAWVIYMGNNEVHGPFGAGTVFGGRETPLWVIRGGLAMQRTRIGQLLAMQWSRGGSGVPRSWGGMEMFLDHQVRHDDPSLNRVHDQFAANLSDILDTAANCGTPVVLSTVVSNLKDCGPFASLHRQSFSRQDLGRWQERFQHGCQAQTDGHDEEAVKAFQEAAGIDPEFAELQFRLGECLLRLGQTGPALERFELAREYDTLRFRASSRINEIITSEAQSRGARDARFVDAAREFSERSPHGIAGKEFLLEHVHFNFAGNYLLAKLLAEQLAAVLQLERDPVPRGDWPSENDCAERLGLTPYHRLLIAREVKSRLASPPFDQQVDHSRRVGELDAEIARLSSALSRDALRAAVRQYQQLLADDPDDWMLRKQFSALLESTGDLDGAIGQWNAITRQLPHYAEGYYKLGTLLNRAKKWDEAEQALRTALGLHPRYARASNSLGICLSHQGRFDECYAQFATAVELRPGYAEAYVNWGQVLASQGDTAGSLDRYRAALQADADYVPAHVQLGKHFVAAEQYADAEVHYRAVARLKPDDAAARLNLGLLYMKMKQYPEAVRELQSAVDLNPTLPTAKQALAHARRMAQ